MKNKAKQTSSYKYMLLLIIISHSIMIRWNNGKKIFKKKENKQGNRSICKLRINQKNFPSNKYLIIQINRYNHSILNLMMN